MKTQNSILILILTLLLSKVSQSQTVITDTASLRFAINTEIVANNARQITADKLNRILNGYINVLERQLKVDTAYRLNDSTIRFRKNGSNFDVAVHGAGTASIDTIFSFHTDSIVVNKKLRIPLTDTTHAKKGKGNIIFDTINVHYYGYDGTAWECFDCVSSSTNFANTDLTFTGDRRHNARSHTLGIDSLSGFALNTPTYVDGLFGIFDTGDWWIGDAPGDVHNTNIFGSDGSQIISFYANYGINFLPITTTNRNAIPSPDESRLIYNYTTHEYNYWNGSGWTVLSTGSGGTGWSLTGNTGTTPSNFIGTTDNRSLRFRTNNVERMIIDSVGNVGIGTNNPGANFKIKGFYGDGSYNIMEVLDSLENTLFHIDESGLVRIGYGGASSGMDAQVGTTDLGDWNDAGNSTKIRILDGSQVINYNANLGHSFTGNVGIGTATPSALLEVSDGSNQLLAVDKTAGAEFTLLKSHNNTNDGNSGYFQSNTTNADGRFTLDANFNDGSTEAAIIGLANTTAATISYIATNHSFTGNVLPSVNNIYDLGNPTYKWKSAYLAGSIYLGAAKISDSGYAANKVLTANADGSNAVWKTPSGGGGLQNAITNDPVLTTNNTIDGGGKDLVFGNLLSLYYPPHYYNSSTYWSSSFDTSNIVFSIGGHASKINSGLSVSSTISGVAISVGSQVTSSNTIIQADTLHTIMSAANSNGTRASNFQLYSEGALFGQNTIAYSVDPSAAVEMRSTIGGLLVPKMTTTQKNAISSPAEGLMVYDLTLHKLYVYDGTTWQAAW